MNLETIHAEESPCYAKFFRCNKHNVANVKGSRVYFIIVNRDGTLIRWFDTDHNYTRSLYARQKARYFLKECDKFTAWIKRNSK